MDKVYIAVGYALKLTKGTKYLYKKDAAAVVKSACHQRGLSLNDDEVNEAAELVVRGYTQGVAPHQLIDDIWVDEAGIEIEIQ